MANKTPDIVEWMPDLKVKYHKKIPIKKYGKNFFTPNLLNTIKVINEASISNKWMN